MAKHVIHVSDDEVANDFAALMIRVRAGAKVIIENGERRFVIRILSTPQRQPR